jgi:predicted phosphodiesterase
MRFLILSDIHANQAALDAVLAASQDQWERVACLGDLVGYGPDPNEVIGCIRGLSAVTIRGNHDKAGCGMDDASSFNPVARAAVDWTREHLTASNIEYLKQLPIGPQEVDGLVLVHGALQDEDEYVFAPAQALDGLIESPSSVTFFGHTHVQGGFSLHDNTVGSIRVHPGGGNAADRLKLDTASRYLLNPGSVGQPRDGDPRAAYAIADLDERLVEFWRVPYDVEAVQKRMADAGLPEPLILRLSFGR